MDVDVRRIAFVTRRFRELQGLRAGAAGIWAAVGCRLLGALPDRYWGVVMLGTIVVRKLVDEPLRDYYVIRFGSVAPDRRTLWREKVLPVVAVFSGLVVDVRLAGTGWPSVTALLLATRIALALVSDWRFRPYLAIALALDLLAAVIWPLGTPDLNHASLVIAVVASADLLTGWLDHRLLTAVLKPRDLAEMAPDVATPGAVLHLHDE